VSTPVLAVGNEETHPVGFLSLARGRNFRLLWAGQLVSELGNRFHWIAVSLWVFSLTHSAAAVSLAISSMFVGSLIVGLWAGVFVDRFTGKAILIVSDIVRAFLVALLPQLIVVDLRLAYADLVIISIATAFFRPAMFAAIPQVVSRRALMSANSAFSAMDTGTEILGPAVAGVLAAAYGYASLLYIDATTYAISALCILGMTLAERNPGDRREIDVQSVWRAAVDGFRYIRTDRLQWGLFVLIFPAYLVGSGLNALQTPLAKAVVGITDAEFGTFNSVWGVGFVIASLSLGWYGARARRSVIILGGYFLAFVSVALMGLSTSFQTLLLTGFAVGFANTFYYVGQLTLLMERTPQELIGRVMSTRQTALSSVRVLAPLIFGALAEKIGIRQAVIAMALVGATGTAAAVASHPVLIRFDRAASKNEHSFAMRWLVSGPVDPMYDQAQQKWMNVMAIGLFLVGWLWLFYSVPQYAVRVALMLGLTALIGILARSRGWIP